MALCKATFILHFVGLIFVLTSLQCNAQDDSNSVLSLLNYKVIGTQPSHYQVAKPTTVTFSANLRNDGPNPLNSSTNTVCVLFFFLPSELSSISHVGQVNITLPVYLSVGQKHLVTGQTVDVTLTHDACRNHSGRQQLCAGTKIDGSSNNPVCINFTAVSEGGVGEIDCTEELTDTPIPTIAIVLIVVVVLILICFIILVIFLYRKFVGRPSVITETSNYESTVPKARGEENLAVEIDYEIENPYATRVSVTGAQTSTQQSRQHLFQRRPSEQNPYNFESSAMLRLCPTILEQTEESAALFQLEGVTTDDTATDRRSLALTRISVHETAVDAQPGSVKRVPEEQVTLGPDLAPGRQAIDDVPQRDPPDQDLPPTRPCPVLEHISTVQIVDPDQDTVPPSIILNGCPNDPPERADPEDDHPTWNRYPNSGPVPNPYPVLVSEPPADSAIDDIDGITITVPDIQQKASLKNPSVLKQPGVPPTPKPRKISLADTDETANVKVHVDQTLSEDFETHEYYNDNPYLPPKPMMTRHSSKTVDGNEKAAASAKPPTAKPRPHIQQEDKEIPQPPPRPPPRKKSVTEMDESESKPAPRPRLMPKPRLSLPRSQSDASNTRTPLSVPAINFENDVQARSGPANISSTQDVDHSMLKNAIERVMRESVVNAPSIENFDISHLSPEATETIPENPHLSTDPAFIQAVMENYLSLMHEISRGEEEYNTAMKRELERIDSNTLSVEPRMEYRRKSLSAQLTLTLARNQPRRRKSAEVYVNQWDRSWEFKRENLEVDTTSPLGEGQFGKVYKGKANGVRGREGSVEVAVKVLKDDAASEAKDEFLKELAIHTIMKSHPHVVQLIGCCIRDDPISILTEYLSGGNLLGYLRERPPDLAHKEATQHYVAKFGLHIARGMAYVAQMEIVHRDLAARNILISENEVCKVADFGFARDIFGTSHYTRAPDKAPIRWYAPEAILDDIFSTKSDVWSFGILLFEVATLGKVAPYHNKNNAEVRLSVSVACHPKRPPHCNDQLFGIMKACWAKDPDDRPTFQDLVKILEAIQDSYPDPRSQGESPPDVNGDSDDSYATGEEDAL